jgi:hypothetical protein
MRRHGRLCRGRERGTTPHSTLNARYQSGYLHMLTHTHAAYTCCLHMLPTHAVYTCCLHMLPTHAVYTCCLHMLPTHAAYTCCLHMLTHAAYTCCLHMLTHAYTCLHMLTVLILRYKQILICTTLNCSVVEKFFHMCDIGEILILAMHIVLGNRRGASLIMAPWRTKEDDSAYSGFIEQGFIEQGFIEQGFIHLSLSLHSITA